jgi:hypothetical protein
MGMGGAGMFLHDQKIILLINQHHLQLHFPIRMHLLFFLRENTAGEAPTVCFINQKITSC